MNKAQKQVLTKSLSDEEKQLKWLEQVYNQAAKDTATKIAELSSRKDMENLQSIVYQKKYQEAIQTQINETLADLHSTTYNGISDYLNQCYENGYVGAMYDIASQGIPIISPIDQKQVIKAIQIDSNLSQGMYDRLGEDVSKLKMHIKAQVSRGIVNGSSWNDVAEELAKKMTSPFEVSKHNAMRIARTEGHRVQMESAMDACIEAKNQGADIVKQWDATLDDRTRPTHQMVDGEIRELDEPFSNGLMFPSDPSGAAEEVINCRCALLQRARWALDEEELQILRDRADYFGLDKTDNFTEFQDKYLKLPDNANDVEIVTQKEIEERFNKLQLTTNKLNGVMSEKDYETYIRTIAENPEISKLYSHADDLRNITYVDGVGCFYPSRNDLEFSYPMQRHIDDGMSKYRTVAHEYGHFFDTFARRPDKFDSSILSWNEMQAIKDGVGAKYVNGLTQHHLSNSDQFLSAVRKDFESINKKSITEYCLSEGRRNVTTGIQDAVDGWGLGRIAWGHGDKYYNREYNSLKSWSTYTSVDPTKSLKDVYTNLGFDASNQAKVKKIVRQYETTSELWANMISAETTGGKELETIMEKFPEAYKAMKEIIKGVK